MAPLESASQGEMSLGVVSFYTEHRVRTDRTLKQSFDSVSDSAREGARPECTRNIDLKVRYLSRNCACSGPTRNIEKVDRQPLSSSICFAQGGYHPLSTTRSIENARHRIWTLSFLRGTSRSADSDRPKNTQNIEPEGAVGGKDSELFKRSTRNIEKYHGCFPTRVVIRGLLQAHLGSVRGFTGDASFPR